MTTKSAVLSYSVEEKAAIEKKIRNAIVKHLLVKAAVTVAFGVVVCIVSKKLENSIEEESE